MASILKAQKRLNLQHSVYINSWNPIFGINYKGEFKESIQAYYCYDEISASRWISKHGTRLEKEYVSKADIVITTSKELQKTKGQLNPNCHLVPNGVNINLFKNYTNQTLPEYRIDKTGYKKIIGYIGTIDDRIDLILMRELCQNLPEYLFVFLGRITDPVIENSLSSFSNVRLTPPVNPSLLPAYINQFDACIIPFVKNEFTKNVYPMKINEYLALGKPVILTNFSDLEEFSLVCKIVSSPSSFQDALVEELESDSEIKQNIRIKMANENSWEKRAEAFGALLIEKPA